MSITIHEATKDARNKSRSSGRGRVDGRGRGADGTLVGREGGDAIVLFSTLRRGVAAGDNPFGVASISRVGYDAGYGVSSVKFFC